MALKENGPNAVAGPAHVFNSLSQSGPEKKPSMDKLLEEKINSVDLSGAEVTPREKDDLRDSDAPGDSVDFSDQFGDERNHYREFADTVNQLRYNCGMFVNNPKVQFLIIFLISINAIMMGIGTYDFVKDDPQLNDIFETIDKSFLIVFTAELFLQFVYHGWKLLLDGWLVFDLAIILTSWSFSSVQIIRAFRIFRALRLVTRIKIMKNLILALFGVVPRMAAIGLMLGLIFYIFAVMFTQLFSGLHTNDNPTQSNYFGGMGWTLFTLFQMMTLDNWASICREVMVTYPWAWLPFVSFVIICGFIVVNLIIAVICDAIASLHQNDKAMIQGYEEETDSQGSAPLEIREQLDCLEEQMEELTRIQARTFHTLQYLTRQMQMHKLRKELTSKSMIADAARNLKKVQRQLSQRPCALSDAAKTAALSLQEDLGDDDIDEGDERKKS